MIAKYFKMYTIYLLLNRLFYTAIARKSAKQTRQICSNRIFYFCAFLISILWRNI